MDVCTYLFFAGDCQEAIELYKSALGAELLHLSRFEDAPEFPAPPGGGHLIFHATLRIGSTVISLNDDPQMERGRFRGFAFLLHLDREEEVDRVCEHLSQGGQVNLAPIKTMWAKRYGIVTDRFGVAWKLQVS